MDLYSVLEKPVLTEKANGAREEHGQYTFVVNKLADKLQVKKAVKLNFGVDVESVNLLVRRGKVKRRGQSVGSQANTKRAIVSLKKGQKIAIFEDK